jgi:hypothetical protein
LGDAGGSGGLGECDGGFIEKVEEVELICLKLSGLLGGCCRSGVSTGRPEDRSLELPLLFNGMDGREGVLRGSGTGDLAGEGGSGIVEGVKLR